MTATISIFLKCCVVTVNNENGAYCGDGPTTKGPHKLAQARQWCRDNNLPPDEIKEDF